MAPHDRHHTEPLSATRPASGDAFTATANTGPLCCADLPERQLRLRSTLAIRVDYFMLTGVRKYNPGCPLASNSFPNNSQCSNGVRTRPSISGPNIIHLSCISTRDQSLLTLLQPRSDGALTNIRYL